MIDVLKIVFVIGLLFSCSSKMEVSTSDELLLELEIYDSIQVDIAERINTFDFLGGRGLMYGFQTRELVLFDTTGKTLTRRSFPEEGPGSLGYTIDVRLMENGDCFVYSFGNQLTLLSEELDIKKKYEMDFPAELRGSKYYQHVMDINKGKGYLFFPGRDGGNPYLKDFYKKYSLLEKLDLESGNSVPFLKLPKVSKYHDELTYEYPNLAVSIHGSILYLALDKESYVHSYDLEKEGELKASIDFHPEKFLQKEGSKEESVSSYGAFKAGGINSLFGITNGVAVHYHEGIEQDVFQQEKLLKKENWIKIPDYNKQKMIVYTNDKGWSNEIDVPEKILAISGMTDLNKPFWGLRYDDYVNLEEDFKTIYKMRLVKKQVAITETD
tara:strand:- start:455 stop:1603 length:1149 start_codon:yes stop_codon:yes gene_type:complete